MTPPRSLNRTRKNQTLKHRRRGPLTQLQFVSGGTPTDSGTPGGLVGAQEGLKARDLGLGGLFRLSLCLFLMDRSLLRLPLRFPRRAFLRERLLQFALAPFDGALHAQVVLARLIGVVGVFFLGEGLQGTHGLPHFDGLHPLGQSVGVQAFPFFEEFEPALLFAGDRLGGEFAQLEEGDAAVVEQAAAPLVAQPIAVGLGGVVRLGWIRRAARSLR